MKKQEIKFEITSTIDEDQLLLSAITNLNDEQRSDLAIGFGDDSDISYELILLRKVISMITELYTPDDEDDVEMAKLSEKLLPIIPVIDSLLD